MSATSSSQADDVRDRVDGFVFLLYQVLWMYPIYCISFILNTIWYQEIADDGTHCNSFVSSLEVLIVQLTRRLLALAYMQIHGKPAPTPVADMIRCACFRLRA